MPCSSLPWGMHLRALADCSNPAVQKSDWLQLVAMHSDTWLISVAFFNGSRLDAQQRCGACCFAKSSHVIHCPAALPSLLIVVRYLECSAGSSCLT